MNTIELQELRDRIAKLHQRLCDASQPWDAALIFSKVNGYYFTGTFQDGVFVLKRDGSYMYFVRRSFDRAKLESPLDEIASYGSFRDLLPFLGGTVKNIYIEAEVLPYAQLQRIQKHLQFDSVHAMDKVILKLRAVKSNYELECIRESGRRQSYFLESVVPTLLQEGMSEVALTGKLYDAMLQCGHQGIARFAMFQTEFVGGQMGFSENALYPCNFDGPGGMKGLHPAVPIIGDSQRLLKKGDLVFIDFAFGVHGYHTDRTQIYMFGAEPSLELVAQHRRCLEVQNKIAARLVPGNIPSEIYAEIVAGGFTNRQVKFFGHGVGLHVDEYPVIAKGFDAPLEKNMVLAIEPKIGIDGIGLVGGEDTYIVTEDGGACVTGGPRDIIVINM